MTTELKSELTMVFGRELTPLELAKTEAAFLRHGFRRQYQTLPAVTEAEAIWECPNIVCRWTGKKAQSVNEGGISCCPKCDHALRIVPANLKK